MIQNPIHFNVFIPIKWITRFISCCMSVYVSKFCTVYKNDIYSKKVLFCC